MSRNVLRAFWIAVAAVVAFARVPAAEEMTKATAGMLRGENDRIREMLRLESTGDAGTREIPAPRAAPPRPRGDGPVRRIEVTTAEALARALALARPGDVIRIADGIYRGNFAATLSGTEEAPITLWGSRAAILDGGTIATGYGFHLRADHWILSGFSVRNARKGIMADGARHDVLAGLEVYRIGEEGVHFRGFSTDNLLEGSWIHDAGRLTPRYGEGVYIGSASSNWGEQTRGMPDECDRNRVVGNLIGPNVAAECVDAKEGSTGGEVRGNVFLATGVRGARSWVDLKGNRYTVEDNTGSYRPNRDFQRPVRVVETLPGWGLDNVVRNNPAREDLAPEPRQPFRARHGRGPATVVLPRRALPYSMSEVSVRFPESVERVEPDVLLLHEHVLVCPDAGLSLTERDARELRLHSQAHTFVSLIGVDATLSISGTNGHRLWIRSWDPGAGGPDRAHEDGRAYLSSIGGRMDLTHVDATDLGFGTGRTSGVSWKGRPGQKCRGSAAHARFERNYWGAFTFEADQMQWVGNVFANNVGYGFDPHDHSDRFLVEDNAAFGNGSHGFIFSRGCMNNVLRKNVSHSNRGHGIMIDDGKVRNDGNPRHAYAVPSNDNVLEENEVWDNEAGIAFEGGTGNVIRGNRIHDNQLGIRLEGDASGNQIVANEILASKSYGIYIYNGSDRNRVLDNRIEGGVGGIVVKRSVENVIERNAIAGIGGRGIVLEGDVKDSGVLDNRIHGRGSSAIDIARASGLELDRLAGNRTIAWMPTREFRPALLVWMTILLVPLAVGLPVRWALRVQRMSRGAARASARRRRSVAIGTLLAALATIVPATAGAARGQSLALTAGLASTFDDNILNYSREQIRDLDSGQYPYRFGVSQVGDWVYHPALALLWQSQLEGGRRRMVSVGAEGDVFQTNGIANFGEIGMTWREVFARGRRLSLSYSYSPSAYMRRLYDADLASLPSTERYRDASVSLHTGGISWRQAVPKASWLDLGYRYDRTRYEPEFRERDSDTHQADIGIGWERRPRLSSFRLYAGYVRRDARADDGLGAPGNEPDLGYHGFEMGAGGSMELLRGRTWSCVGDARYDLELRQFDSDRTADHSHYGRRDQLHRIELGLGARTGAHWSARGFFRIGDNYARYGSTAVPGSEVGGYHDNQAGIELQWSGELWRRNAPRAVAATSRGESDPTVPTGSR